MLPTFNIYVAISSIHGKISFQFRFWAHFFASQNTDTRSKIFRTALKKFALRADYFYIGYIQFKIKAKYIFIPHKRPNSIHCLIQILHLCIFYRSRWFEVCEETKQDSSPVQPQPPPRVRPPSPEKLWFRPPTPDDSPTPRECVCSDCKKSTSMSLCSCNDSPKLRECVCSDSKNARASSCAAFMIHPNCESAFALLEKKHEHVDVQL